MIGYFKHFDSNKTMSFKVNDNRLLKKYTEIWERVSSLMNIEFDSEPVYGDNDKCIKTKIKSYGDKINTNFQGKKTPKKDASYKCLSLIVLDSAIRVNKKYYPQTLLEEYKYGIEKNKMENLINDDLDQVHLTNLKMDLIMNLIMDLTVSLTIHWLRIKTVCSDYMESNSILVKYHTPVGFYFCQSRRHKKCL